jgi:hypothetical protein
MFQSVKAAADGGATVWAIGVDSDQYTVPALAEYKDIILTSMLKRVDVAVFDVIKGAVDGAPLVGIQAFDLSKDGVGYSSSNSAVSEFAAAADAADAEGGGLGTGATGGVGGVGGVGAGAGAGAGAAGGGNAAGGAGNSGDGGTGDSGSGGVGAGDGGGGIGAGEGLAKGGFVSKKKTSKPTSLASRRK